MWMIGNFLVVVQERMYVCVCVCVRVRVHVHMWARICANTNKKPEQNLDNLLIRDRIIHLVGNGDFFNLPVWASCEGGQHTRVRAHTHF